MKSTHNNSSSTNNSTNPGYGGTGESSSSNSNSSSSNLNANSLGNPNNPGNPVGGRYNKMSKTEYIQGISQMCISPKGTHLAIMGAGNANENPLFLWEISEQALFNRPVVVKNKCIGLAFEPNSPANTIGIYVCSAVSLLKLTFEWLRGHGHRTKVIVDTQDKASRRAKHRLNPNNPDSESPDDPITGFAILTHKKTTHGRANTYYPLAVTRKWSVQILLNDRVIQHIHLPLLTDFWNLSDFLSLEEKQQYQGSYASLQSALQGELNEPEAQDLLHKKQKIKTVTFIKEGLLIGCDGLLFV